MVVKQVKHWLVARANASHWRPIKEWAEARGGRFVATEDGVGFAVDCPKVDLGRLRIEWGESQRSYMPGFELRMRCELGLPVDLQLMALDRVLMEELEHVVFEAYTDTLKTRADTDTPEEMRWLVMLQKFNPAASPLLRQRVGFVGATQALAAAWVEGELGEALIQAGQDLLPEGHPFVLMSMRGNLYLRTAMPDADAEKIQALVRLLECAAREAARLGERLSESGTWRSTSAAAWQNSMRPSDEG